MFIGRVHDTHLCPWISQTTLLAMTQVYRVYAPLHWAQIAFISCSIQAGCLQRKEASDNWTNKTLPAPSAMTLSSPGSSTIPGPRGLSEEVLASFRPSLPYVWSPKESTSPSLVNARVWALPAPICVTVLPSREPMSFGRGTRLSSTFPSCARWVRLPSEVRNSHMTCNLYVLGDDVSFAWEAEW